MTTHSLAGSSFHNGEAARRRITGLLLLRLWVLLVATSALSSPMVSSVMNDVLPRGAWAYSAILPDASATASASYSPIYGPIPRSAPSSLASECIANAPTKLGKCNADYLTATSSAGYDGLVQGSAGNETLVWAGRRGTDMFESSMCVALRNYFECVGDAYGCDASLKDSWQSAVSARRSLWVAAECGKEKRLLNDTAYYGLFMHHGNVYDGHFRRSGRNATLRERTVGMQYPAVLCPLAALSPPSADSGSTSKEYVVAAGKYYSLTVKTRRPTAEETKDCVRCGATSNPSSTSSSLSSSAANNAGATGLDDVSIISEATVTFYHPDAPVKTFTISAKADGAMMVSPPPSEVPRSIYGSPPTAAPTTTGTAAAGAAAPTPAATDSSSSFPYPLDTIGVEYIRAGESKVVGNGYGDVALRGELVTIYAGAYGVPVLRFGRRLTASKAQQAAGGYVYNATASTALTIDYYVHDLQHGILVTGCPSAGEAAEGSSSPPFYYPAPREVLADYPSWNTLQSDLIINFFLGADYANEPVGAYFPPVTAHDALRFGYASAYSEFMRYLSETAAPESFASFYNYRVWYHSARVYDLLFPAMDHEVAMSSTPEGATRRTTASTTWAPPTDPPKNVAPTTSSYIDVALVVPYRPSNGASRMGGGGGTVFFLSSLLLLSLMMVVAFGAGHALICVDVGPTL